LAKSHEKERKNAGSSAAGKRGDGGGGSAGKRVGAAGGGALAGERDLSESGRGLRLRVGRASLDRQSKRPGLPAQREGRKKRQGG